MYCDQCGKPLPDGAIYCPQCGARSSHVIPETVPDTVKEVPRNTEKKEGKRSGRGRKRGIVVSVCAVCAAAVVAAASILLLRFSKIPPNGNLSNGGILVTCDGTHLYAVSDSSGYSQEYYDNSRLKFLDVSDGRPVLTDFLRGMYQDLCVFQNEVYCIEMTVPSVGEWSNIPSGAREYSLIRLDLETGEKQVFCSYLEPVSIVGVTENGVYFTAYSNSHSRTSLKHLDPYGVICNDGIEEARLVTENGIFSIPSDGRGLQHTTLDGSSWTLYQSLKNKSITSIMFEVDGYLYMRESTASGNSRIIRLNTKDDTCVDISQEIELAAVSRGFVSGCTFEGKHLYFTYSVSGSGYSYVIETNLNGQKPKVITRIDTNYQNMTLSFVDRYHLAISDAWKSDPKIIDIREAES